MQRVRVRTLTGLEATVEVAESATVAELRAELRRQPGFGGSVALFVGGRRLSDGAARVASLPLPRDSAGAFVASCCFLPRGLIEAVGGWMFACRCQPLTALLPLNQPTNR